MTVDSGPPTAGKEECDSMHFWAAFAAQIEGFEIIPARSLDQDRLEAPGKLAESPCAKLYHQIMAVEQDMPEAHAQRLCVNGIFRYARERLKIVPTGLGTKLELDQSSEIDAGIQLTSELVAERLKSHLPNWTTDQFNQAFPPAFQYYVGMTSAVDWLRWERKLIDNPRHHLRCGKTVSCLADMALVDAFVQQPEEGFLKFLQPLLLNNGSVSLLAAKPSFVHGVRAALRFVEQRFPRHSEERMKIESLWLERDPKASIAHCLSCWKDHSVAWFQVRELLHDFTREPVALFQ